MRLITIVITILIFSSSCGEKVPEGVVSQRQMGAVLLDMHLADGRLASMEADSARMYRDAYYDAIFKHYAIDSTTFKQSVEFYATRPQLMKALYVDIEKKLEGYSADEQRAIEEKYSAQRRADSIASARHTDSLRKVAHDSLDFKRKRYLLRLDGPDSLHYGQPIPVTYMLLRERMMEAIGLGGSDQYDYLGNTTHDEPTKPPVIPIAVPKIEEQPTSILQPLKKIN